MIFMVYHGSGDIVESPEIRVGRFTKDFGPAFYCTRLLDQAKSFARRRKRLKGTGYVNYYMCLDTQDLNIKVFNGYSLEWLDFVVSCREGFKHDFDIVIGPVADDTVHRVIREYSQGTLTKEQLFNKLKFHSISDQVAFCTDKAIGRLIYKGVVDNV